VERKIATVQRDVGGRTVRFVLSDSSVDRMNDTVNVGGWDLESYRRNPVVLFAHDSSSPPIGRANSVWSDGTKLLADVEFAPAETYAFADTIFRLVKGGFLKSGSVGFLPLDYKFSERPGGVDYKRQELLEFSIVPVPANANTLVAARMKGVISIRDMRRLRRAADDDPTPTPAIGNCGRPANEECGLKNENECAIHRQEGGWNGDNDGDASTWDGRQARQLREAHLRIVRARRAKLNAPTPLPVNETRAARADYVRRLRERHGLAKPDPRIVTADCQFRMRRW
jgi:HK97 family phage prohead protease